MKNTLNNGFDSFEKENRLIFRGRKPKNGPDGGKLLEEMILKDNPELAQKYSPEGLAKEAQRKADEAVAKAGNMSFAEMAENNLTYKSPSLERERKKSAGLRAKKDPSEALGKEINEKGSGIFSKEQVPAYVSDPLDYARNHLDMLNDAMLSPNTSDEAFNKASDALIFLAGRSGEAGQLARKALRNLAGRAVEISRDPKTQEQYGYFIEDVPAFTRATREIRSSLDDFDELKNPTEQDIAKLQETVVKNLKVMQEDRIQLIEE